MINEKPQYITIQKAAKAYGVSSQVLRNWDRDGFVTAIRSPNNIRMFSIKDLENALNINRNDDKKKRYIYCRVSSNKQKDDLIRQREFLQRMYPQHDIIEDVGSGINFKRKGIQTILEQSMLGNIEEIVVAYKDRLARFGYELIESIVNKGGGKITIINDEKFKSCEQELAEDLLAIIHIFNCRQMGKRRYSSKKSQS